MVDTIAAVVLAVLALGQLVVCLRKGLFAGVVYYLAVAPMGYFSVWALGTWDPVRLCGMILAGYGAFSGRGLRGFWHHPLAWFALYGVVITAVGSLTWPYGAMEAKSVIYGSARGAVQLVTYAVSLAVAWFFAQAMTSETWVRRATTTILVVGCLLSLYGVYQFVASKTGLPMTGIRRPYAHAIAGVEAEEHAVFVVRGQDVFRPGSLIGEPKGLGGACVFWLYLMVVHIVSRPQGRHWPVVAVAFPLVCIALWMTASTSAWVGALVALALVAVSGVLPRGLQVTLVFGIGIVAIGLMSVASFWPSAYQYLADVIELRLLHRLQDPLQDLAEAASLVVLGQRLDLILLGAGKGGISFYIAEVLRTDPELVLAPNNGLLSLICDVGVVGVLLLMASGYRGAYTLLSRKGSVDQTTRALALAGIGVFSQTLIFGSVWMFSAAVGLLIAAELRSVRCKVEYRSARGSFTGGRKATQWREVVPT